jgi:zinc transporter 1/2/3
MMSLVLLVALSTHALFEGIALGLTTDFTSTLNIMLGLLFHKIPASMSLGISLSKSFKNDEDKKRAIRLQLVFSFATPIGIALGMLLQSASAMVEIVFSSFAAGTFIYIAASEVIVEEFSILGHKKWIKMLAFALGAALITCMWLIE